MPCPAAALPPMSPRWGVRRSVEVAEVAEQAKAGRHERGSAVELIERGCRTSTAASARAASSAAVRPARPPPMTHTRPACGGGSVAERRSRPSRATAPAPGPGPLAPPSILNGPEGTMYRFLNGPWSLGSRRLSVATAMRVAMATRTV